jgi:predicted flap endonuclease-1-like 5' DNA nuclease
MYLLNSAPCSIPGIIAIKGRELEAMVYLWNAKSGPLSSVFKQVTQAQQEDSSTRIPLWIWLAGGLVVVAIGVMWTLYEENEARKRERYVAPGPGPVRGNGGAASTTRPDLRSALAPAAPVARPVETETTGTVEREAAPPKPDDLKAIVGIGPKIAKILNEYGIFTFEQLANTEISFLEKLLEEREWHMADPGTWPAQAKALAEQKRDRNK